MKAGRVIALSLILSVFFLSSMTRTDAQTCSSPSGSAMEKLEDEEDGLGRASCPSTLTADSLNQMMNGDAGVPRSCHRWQLNASSPHKVTLGVLMPIYTLSTEKRTCSQFRSQLGPQLVEALHLAVQGELQKPERESLRAVLGAVEIRDSCFSPRFCVQQAVTLAVSSPQAAHYCRSNFSEAFQSLDPDNTAGSTLAADTCPYTERVAAIVGPGISSTLKVVAPTLSIFQIPHISYWATSDAFSKKKEYPYLFRTVPSDDYQARAMVRLLARYGWTYVVALSSNDEITGGLGLDAFRHAIAEYKLPDNTTENMCIAFEERFHFRDKDKVRQIVERVVNEENAQAIMLFSGQRYADSLFSEMKAMYNESETLGTDFHKKMDKKHFVWIASDGWVAQGINYLYAGGKLGGNHTLLGFVFRVPDKFWPEAQNFSETLINRITDISVKDNVAHNPWLSLMLPDECKTASDIGYGTNVTTPPKPQCSTVTFDRTFPPVESGSLMLAVRAALAMIDNAFNCSNRTICSGQSGSKLRNEMRNVTSTCTVNNSTSACHVFQNSNTEDHSQDLQASYLVKSGVLNDNGSAKLVTVYQWDVVDGDSYRYGYLTPVNQIRWGGGRADEPPESICAKPCVAGQRRGYNDATQRNSRCCWECINCWPNKYQVNETCQTCPKGHRPNENYTDCVAIPPEYIDYSQPAALAIISLAALGICVILATALIFHQFRNTKVVQSTGRALTNLLLSSLLIGFVSCMVFFNEPSTGWCSIFAILASAVIIFSTVTVLVRTLRLANNNREEAESDALYFVNIIQLTTFRAQLMFITVVTAIPLLILMIWVAADPFQTTLDNDSDQDKVFLQCERKWAYSGVVAFLPVSIIAMTAIMAFQTRKLPSEYNEAKLLLFTAFALCVLWIALTPTFFVTDRVLEPVIVALTVLAHMLAIWFCLYLPRLYIIILRPQRNPVVEPAEPDQEDEQRRQSRWSLGRKSEQNGEVKVGNGKLHHGSSDSSPRPSSATAMLENHANGALTVHKGMIETSL